MKAITRPTSKEIRTIEIQMDAEDIQIERDKMEGKVREEINRALSSKDDFNSLANIVDENWPEECYKVTDTESGNLYSVKINGDLAVFLDPNTKLGDKTLQALVYRFPAATTLVNEGLTEGHLEFIRVQTEIVSSTGDRERMSNTTRYNNAIYAFPVKMGDGRVDDVKVVFELCRKLREELTHQKTKSIKIATLGQLSMDYLRKCVEYVFHDTGCKVTIITMTNKGLERRKPGREGNKRMKGPGFEKIIVKAQGKTYTDLLRSVKNNVNVDEAGIRIKALRKTNSGDLLLEVNGKENAVRPKDAIIYNTGNTEVMIKTNDIVVHMADIDADIGEDDINILSLRPMANGNQAATVLLKRNVAEDFDRRGKIKIGWVLCRVRNRVQIVTIFVFEY